MGKHRSRGRSQNRNGAWRTVIPDAEMSAIREQQRLQHQMTENNARQGHRGRSPKLRVSVLLESGVSFSGVAVALNSSNTHKCKLFFRNRGGTELGLEADVNISVSGADKFLQASINNQLLLLHENAVMEFPEWLEKYSVKSNEVNPYFNLDEIREEFKYKKVRYGVWKKAAEIGFFDNMRPQPAKFNRIIRLELQSLDEEVPIEDLQYSTDTRGDNGKR